ncbi:membrane protein [Gordonia phage Vine]|uniref:Membrane protein n=1 Tax=Gordonia phage Vine TaxID=2857501 RepID=A0AAE7XBR3_9CAUD|nr:membrane protein [Gordonia phage Vine]QZD97734.1 membrane protein [Gordonia phage Vine]
MNPQLVAFFAGLVGLIIGFTLGQFFNLDLRPWHHMLVPAVHKRERRRKLPWNRVIAMFMLVAIFYTVISNSIFQDAQAECNEENRINSAQRSAAIQEDNELSLRDRVNLGVVIRVLLNAPQPSSPAVDAAVGDLRAYLDRRGPLTPEERSEAALDWYQVEQQEIISTFLKNQEIRAAFPTVTKCKVD